MGHSKKITDGALLVAVYIILLLIAMFVPFAVLFGIFLLPVPYIIYTSRYGWKSGSIMFFVTIIISFIFATIVSLPLTILSGIGGIVIGNAIKRHVSAYDTWARGTVGFIAGLLLNVMFIQFVLDVNITAELDAMIQDSVQFTKTFMERTGLVGDNHEQIQLIEEQMKMFVDLLPSSIAIMGIIMAFISQWLSYRVISRIENKQLFFPSFRELNLPTSVVWFYFIVLILSLFDFTQEQTLYLIVINAMAILTILLVIQGFSFIFFYAHFKNLHISIPIIIIILSFILPFILLFFVRILGIIDIGFSLKRRISNTKVDK